MGVEKYPHHFVNNFFIKNLHGSILFCTFANFFCIPKKKYKVGWSLLYHYLMNNDPSLIGQNKGKYNI
jgi:hypothetical protein